jgi:ATP-binding cassette subfamily G (WHITE) protein 2 (PDR)
MYNQMRGNITYQAELDLHFPTLTMGEMLEFATNASDNNDQKQDLSAKTEVTVKSLGLTRTLGTKMGNDYISGVSGGERKRGSIAVRTSK